MKKRHIFIFWLVGMVLMTACGKEESMETNSTVTEIESTILYETEEAADGKTAVGSDALNSRQEETTAEPTEEPTEEPATLERLLKIALLPVGDTMYIWGGGWNEEDTGAGPGAVTLGVCPKWAEFAALQDENYNYKEHRYEILKGLDCSGYVGWVVYNLFEKESGKEGYVFKSTETAAKYSELGWGQLLEAPTEFLAGDIVSMKGHVWICLGMCEDGSVVLVHASPPGVSVCGTAPAEGGKSQAVELAKNYMEKYYPNWQEKYPDREVGLKYVTDVSVMRWNEETLSDAKVLQEMSAKEVLKLLFEE
ncbi:MAG: hypothetical protein IJ282_01400 [Lachnospiraceae bacterium]|nr:hypothetical protein [Lachnospiraceae bacterium]